MMGPLGPMGPRRRGFTLLEMIVAFTILALFVVPMLEIIAEARIRAFKYTRDRTLRDLAQRKLFDYMYGVEPLDSGNFEAEGYPGWEWWIGPPELMSQGEQSLLEFTIRVRTPAGTSESGQSGESIDLGEVRPSFEMSAWTYPSPEWQAWLAEQAELGYDGLDPWSMGAGGAYPPGGNLGY